MTPRSGCGTAGFTLVELLVVVAIGVVLATIAVPAYQDHVRGLRRSAAQAMLVEAADRQARYRADNDAYTASLVDLGYATDPAVSESGHYRVSVVLGADGYVLSATPQGTQAADTDCGTLTYDSAGRRGASGSGKCWR